MHHAIPKIHLPIADSSARLSPSKRLSEENQNMFERREREGEISFRRKETEIDLEFTHAPLVKGQQVQHVVMGSCHMTTARGAGFIDRGVKRVTRCYARIRTTAIG